MSLKEDELNRRGTQQKTSSTEDELKGRSEDEFNGRGEQWKTTLNLGPCKYLPDSPYSLDIPTFNKIENVL